MSIPSHIKDHAILGKDVVPVGMVSHEWSGTQLRIQNANGYWGTYVNLVGPQGPVGPIGPSGEIGLTGATGPVGPRGPAADIISGEITSDLTDEQAPQFIFKTQSGTKVALMDYSSASGIPASLSGVSTSSNFIAGRVFNAVWNDIAEHVPSDGTVGPGDLAFVDITSPNFRVTSFQGSVDSYVGIVSEHPGMIVGLNMSQEHPVYLTLKGHVKLWTNRTTLNKGRTLYLAPDGSLKDSDEIHDSELLRSKPVGVVTELGDGWVKVFV